MATKTKNFAFKGLPTRVVFGEGSFEEIASVVASLGCERVLAITTPEQAHLADRIEALLGEHLVGSFTEARMHTPLPVTERALARLKLVAADGLVSIGGGSTTGLGKALAVRTGIPHLAIPTTYAGSEMTDILGETTDAGKVTRRSEQIRPQAVIYDPRFTLSLPIGMSVVSGLNAMGHAVEALYAHDANPIISMMAEAGLKAIHESLPKIKLKPDDLEARTEALYGAWLCGACLGSVSMALHHKVCHVLGGSFDLPHAQTHAVILPHSTAYNAQAAPQAMNVIAAALGCSDAAAGLQDFARELGSPTTLKELGMPHSGIERATDEILSNSYPNPRPLERQAIMSMLADAWSGARISGPHP
ncbi:maleylacetate reductase [Mesorhizobium sp. M0047]|uniref:maleylacetate reductase n=1 Tax=Mesorhizobium sp. M0047 TaxID=2956859 RepID=UPI00333CBC94